MPALMMWPRLQTRNFTYEYAAHSRYRHRRQHAFHAIAAKFSAPQIITITARLRSALRLAISGFLACHDAFLLVTGLSGEGEGESHG